MKTRQTASLVIITVLALAGVVGSLAFDWRPLLGLDLQGGVSVRLRATEPNPDIELLNETVEILRSRVDALGVGSLRSHVPLMGSWCSCRALMTPIVPLSSLGPLRS